MRYGILSPCTYSEKAAWLQFYVTKRKEREKTQFLFQTTPNNRTKFARMTTGLFVRTYAKSRKKRDALNINPQWLKNTERNWRLIQKTVFHKTKSTRWSNYLIRWVYRWCKHSPDSDCHGKKETRDIFISDGIKRSEVISGEVQTTLYRLQRVI